jgi:hypothetical protein
MGRIFSYSTIEQGQVPQAHDFEQATGLFTELAEANIENGALDGSFVYGSAAIGLASFRSDFDTFLSLNSGNAKAYSAARTVIQCVLAETRHLIPIVPIIQTRDALESGHHEMDRFFGQHLTSRYRLVQGNDPASYTRFAENPPSEILSNYLFQKKRRLANAYTSAEPLDVKEGGLQRMLELPQAIGRKASQALAEIGYIPEAVERSADKSMVLARSRTLFSDLGIVEDFDGLVEANNGYDRLLREALNGKVDRETYDDFIRGLHATLPKAINWAEKVGETVLPILNSNDAVIN